MEISQILKMVGEISIAFASFVSHGSYFYPKYHSNAYNFRPVILNKCNKYKPQKKQECNFNNEYHFFINNKSLSFFKGYINCIIKNLDSNELLDINKYIKYYIIMRLLTPISYLNMTKEDQNIISSYIVNVYNSINSIKDILDFIDEFIIVKE